MTESEEKLSKRRGGKNKELAGLQSTTAAKKDGKKVEREGGGIKAAGEVRKKSKWLQNNNKEG